MPYPDDNAIEEGSTPLNSGPETAHEQNFVHRFDSDQPEDYVDPVTRVNQRRPDADEIEARADAAEAAEAGASADAEPVASDGSAGSTSSPEEAGK